MNSSHVGRITGIVTVALGLMFGLLAGSASAQVMDSVPRAHSQVAPVNAVGAQGSASSYGVGAVSQAAEGVSMAASCGYWQRWENGGFRSYYTHCGNDGIEIRIKFGTWWPDYANTWVRPGTTNLSNHWISWDKRSVTGAWCVTAC